LLLDSGDKLVMVIALLPYTPQPRPELAQP
jgi:hypothetical protein